MPINMPAKLPAQIVRAMTSGLIVIIALTATACSRQSASSKTGQAVADVNDSDITYLQLNYFLQSHGIDASKPELVHKTLDALVDQELLVQEALKAKLDRDPDILQALEMARRQILVEAYARNFVYPPAAISEADEKAYYNANPELFEKRKIYDVNIFEIGGEDLEPAVVEELESSRKADEVRAILQRRHIGFGEQVAQRSAEQLPLSMLDQFAQAKVGDVLVLTLGDVKQLIQIVSISDRPRSLTEAKPDIDRFLAGGRNRDAMQARVEQLRGSARINYLGEFAKSSQLVGEATAPASKPVVSDTKNLLSTE